ncbi:uncharacterized protein BJ212DRAFT_1384588 [Suillus subaureus]|uniref:Uncharacterized protein n=1 Tax=Suillus subaureus TaxID=48587 RepID=A0A9P7E0H3_9AGAM|nr:uncharacterized protein BJ212DRAFT_1384588 [Suillus subaureus]KAG1807958.1 hypothetical protein BJ212DRAFT_1384588 [Suillus subaureus]
MLMTTSLPLSTLSRLTVMQAEIPGQEQDGYDTEFNFFYGMHPHSQISRPRPQQRHGCPRRPRLTDEEPSSTTACTTYDPTASRRRYHLQNPPTTSIHPAAPSCNATRRRRHFCPGSTGATGRFPTASWMSDA